MNGTHPPPTAAGKPVLFEVNLIRDRIDSLRRRRRMQNLSMAGALLMLLAGGVVAVMAATNLLHMRKLTAVLESDRRALVDARSLCNHLDRLRKDAISEISFVTPLLTVSRKRVEWNVKLDQFATALGTGGGILMVSGNSGDVYSEADAAAAAFRSSDTASLTFAVMMPAAASARLNAFAQMLGSVPGFTTKLGPVQVESIDLDPADVAGAAILRGSCKAGGPQR